MAIMVISGKPADVRQMAGMMRDAQISQGKGALLLLKPGTARGQEHALEHQLEKIIDTQRFVKGMKADDVPWKPDTMIIVPKTEEDVLSKIDEICPAFTRHFGPIKRMEV
jgi:hypothetical protein